MAGLVLVIILFGAGCRVVASSASPLTAERPLTATPGPTLASVAPGEPSPCLPLALNTIPSPFWPAHSGPHALLAVNEYAHTTFVALEVNGAVPLSRPQLIGKIRVAATGDVLAFEVLEDINPSHNVIVAADLATGAAWRIAPREGCAVFGFTLDPGGARLAVLQVAMRGQSRPAAWQISEVELASGQVRTLAPPQPQAVTLEPVTWSAATDEIVLWASVPFQADGAAGLWAMSAKGERLRLLLAETDYVGRPLLSPDGRLLAFLASEPESLPEAYVTGPGEPPANVVRVLKLVTGQRQTLAVETNQAFDALAWDPAGELLYVSRGAWRDAEHAFWFDEMVSLSTTHLTPAVVKRTPENIAGLQPCAEDGPVYVLTRRQGAAVRWDRRNEEWVVGNGTVEILACR